MTKLEELEPELSGGKITRSGMAVIPVEADATGWALRQLALVSDALCADVGTALYSKRAPTFSPRCQTPRGRRRRRRELALAGMVRRRDDAFLLPSLHERRSLAVSKRQAALDVGHRTLSVAQYDGDGAVV